MNTSCAVSAAAKAASKPTVIGYVTDIEGDRYFWDNYLKISRILTVEREADDGNVVDISLKDGCHFVFGGDVNDQCDGDLYVVEQLVKLKRKYPNRVHFILGNRDMNKLRLVQELSEAHMEKYPWDDYPGTFWTKIFFKESPKDTVARLGIQGDPSPHDRVERLKWILSCTMGSGNAFELRRVELTKLKEAENGVATDEEVYNSFVDNLKPDGIFAEYLKCGSLALVLNDTLFVHGAIDERSLGWNPERPDYREKDIVEWAGKLNAFAAREIKKCLEEGPEEIKKDADAWAMVGGYREASCWNILQYGMGWLPTRERNQTVVYNDWRGTQDLVPALPSSAIVKDLQNHGINRIITGHKPDGDAPLVVANESNTFHVIAADTSYSNDTVWLNQSVAPKPDEPAQMGAEQQIKARLAEIQKSAKAVVTDGKSRHDARRGAAVSEILIHPPGGGEGATGEYSTVEIHGILSSGDAFEAIIEHGNEGNLIGKKVEGDRFVKCQLCNSTKMLVSHSVKWNVYNELLERHEVEKMVGKKE